MTTEIEPKSPTQWQYTNAGVILMGAGLGLFTAGIVFHYYGWIAALVFAVTMVLAQLVAGYATGAFDKSEQVIYNVSRSLVANGVLLLVWTVTAFAMFATGEVAGVVAGMATLVSLIFHVVFAGSIERLGGLILLAIPGLGLLAMLLIAAWTEYPFAIAVCASVASIGTVASFLNAWKLSVSNSIGLTAAITGMEATKQRLEFTIESSGDGYFEVDVKTLEYRPNEAMLRNFGYKNAVSTAGGLRDRIHEDDVGEAFANLKRVIDDELLGWNQDLRIRMADGEYRWMHLRARLLETATERTLLCTLTDLRERKAMEDDLRLAKESAEASSRAKSEFLANMSHEIRTPLNGVLGMAQSLEADGLSDDQRKKVAIILDSGKSLTAILNDVLDLSKIEAGKLEIAPVAGDLLHTMKRVRQLFQVVAEEKGLDLGARFSSDLPQRLVYDPVRVRQCVSNLISNAVKFTAAGRVDVAISSSEIAPGQHMVRIDVIDTGIGLTEETIAKLFSAFTQADSATTRTFGGTGLGLAISRRLARLMGGDLTVVSAPGIGSTFTLTFTASIAEATEQPSRQAPATPRPSTTGSLRGKRVLLTDDNAVNRQVIKLFMAPQGCVVVEATNGKEALDALAGQPFDIVLLDVHMPVMDGKEAIQRLRASKADWSTVPVIALTADAMSGDREKYLALGMTDYVSKPVDQRELIAKMHHVLNLEAPAEAGRKAG